jgi:hypothetical protein
MKIESTSYPGWNNHPTYRVSTFSEWKELCFWMYKNKVEHFLLSSGSTGYIFQVKKNNEWFTLRWL